MTYRQLDLDEAADYTGRTREELLAAVQAGKLRAVGDGADARFLEADLNRFLAGQPTAKPQQVHPIFEEGTLTEEKTYTEALEFASGENGEDEE